MGKVHLSEHIKIGDLFNLSVIQYFMQAIGIIITMLNYHITPFIRNDVVFGYYDIVFQANIFSDFEKDIFMKTYVPYIIQRAFDLTKYDYRVLKEKIGNGLLVNVIIDAFTSKPDIPRPNEIVDFANTKITLDSVK